MFNKLKNKINNMKFKGITWQDDVRPGCQVGLPFICNSNGAYDNAFPDIVRIAEAFAEVKPFAVDRNEKKLVKQPPVIAALYNPNRDMSGTDFFETLITLLLVHPMAHLLVWHYERGKLVSGGPVTLDNIAGFTFLEKAVMSRLDGKVTFRLGDKTWTRADVLTLSLNVNPYNIFNGYSPSMAVKKWATVDDYIAEYQIGQFRNGAVPAGEMIIAAPSVEAYNATVDMLQAHHRGPNNANNIIYTHRPTSSIDGKPMPAGVEWVPFAQSNKDLTLDSLFNQANKKIDMNFGVPEEVKGYLQNSNYASAEVAQYVFQRYVVYPKLVKVYSKLNHELSRVMGGMPYSLSFDYEIPVLTDTRKVQAETLKVMLDAGFSVESSVEALQLPRSFLKLDQSTPKDEENLQVVEDNREKPEQEAKTINKIAKTKALESWQETANPTLKELIELYFSVIFSLVSKLFADTNDNSASAIIDAINRASEQLETNKGATAMRDLIVAELYYLLAEKERDSAQKFATELELDQPVTSITASELQDFNFSIQGAAAYAEAQIAMNDDLADLESEQIKTVVDTISTQLSNHGIDKVISDVDDADTYRTQLVALLVSLGRQRYTELEKRVTEASDNASLPEIIHQTASSNDYLSDRWALSEGHRASELGTLLSAEEAGAKAGLQPLKTWHINPISPDVCEDCVAMDGQTVPADQEFSNGDMVPHYHPHCYCTMSLEFMQAKAVKVCCPNCGRYMLESKGGQMENVICANSKCKKHYDIEVKNGKIKAKERENK